MSKQEKYKEASQLRILKTKADQLAEAIQYYFDMLEEVRGPDWADKPDHVLQKMLKALKNYQEGE